MLKVINLEGAMVSNSKSTDARNHLNTARESAKAGDYMQASFYAAKSMKLFGDAGDSDGLKEAKSASVEYGKKAEDQLKEFEFSIDLDEDAVNEIENFVDDIINSNDIKESLEKIAASRLLETDYKTAQKTASEIVPITAQLVSHISYSDEGHVRSLDNFEGEWLAENYDFQVQLSTMLLNTIFSRLIMSGKLDKDEIIKVISDKGLFTGSHILKLEVILERRFHNDYFSAIHILVPFLEKTFMSLSSIVGLDTVTYKGGKVSTRNANLSSTLLQSEEFQSLWGSNFCLLMDFYLFNENGYRFRHKVSHGDISLQECDFTAYNMLFYFLIKMCMMVALKPKEEEDTD